MIVSAILQRTPRRAFDTLWLAILRCYRARQNRAVLYHLSDHTLHDIGVWRDSIDQIPQRSADAPIRFLQL